MQIGGPPSMFQSAANLMRGSSASMEGAAERISVGAIESGVIDMKVAQTSMDVAIGSPRPPTSLWRHWSR